MNETLEDTARRIAEQGKGALIARFRPAFAEAVSARADVLELSDVQIEEMVQRAADRADGLQWRRALASVASEQLGIGLGEALGHPAVARAQAIAGAPSYEESLAELGMARRAPAPDADDERSMLRVTAIHLAGIANLAREEGGLELQFSDDGLDILRGESENVRRLSWGEIHGLEVAAPRNVRRLRRRDAQLLVRTREGRASFQIPSLTPDELHRRLAPVLERHQRR